VWVLAPLVETDDPALAWYSDYAQSRAEYARAFADLGWEWRWQPVTLRDHRTVIARVARESRRLGLTPVALNLCDGDEVNGAPGLSVIRCLAEHGIRSTGADARFFHVTTSKIAMKRCFHRAGVPTPPWEILAPDRGGTRGIFARLGAPLIIKPAVSAGSMGITTRSVVRTPQGLHAQLRRLDRGYHGWDLTGGGVIAERFIAGREFTTFIVGSADAPERASVYPPVERRFNPNLPEQERFLSFDRLWGMYEVEDPVGDDDEDLWRYRPVRGRALAARIKDVSWDAYAAVGGHGYGRVDLRQDAATGALHVLEVNAQCGISEDPDYTSIGAILRFARMPFSHVVREIITVAGEAAPGSVPASAAEASA
jgi:D-alanine-D-alanine ligase